MATLTKTALKVISEHGSRFDPHLIGITPKIVDMAVCDLSSLLQPGDGAGAVWGATDKSAIFPFPRKESNLRSKIARSLSARLYFSGHIFPQTFSRLLLLHTYKYRRAVVKRRRHPCCYVLLPFRYHKTNCLLRFNYLSQYA